MEQVDNYDYSPSLPFIAEFENPFENVPFIEEMEENFGKLWQFKECVRFWTLGVSRFKNYIYLLHRESFRGSFLPLNLDEKVILHPRKRNMWSISTWSGKTLLGRRTSQMRHSGILSPRLSKTRAMWSGWIIEVIPYTRIKGMRIWPPLSTFRQWRSLQW